MRSMQRIATAHLTYDHQLTAKPAFSVNKNTGEGHRSERLKIAAPSVCYPKSQSRKSVKTSTYRFADGGQRVLIKYQQTKRKRNDDRRENLQVNEIQREES